MAAIAIVKNIYVHQSHLQVLLPNDYDIEAIKFCEFLERESADKKAVDYVINGFWYSS